jgi:hypothetical protein
MKKFLSAALALPLMVLSGFGVHGEIPPVCRERFYAPLQPALRPAGFPPETPPLTLLEGTLQQRLSTFPVGGEAHPSGLNPFLDEEEEYEETPARRFEIIFFISMPVTLGLSFAGLSTYKLAADTWGSYGRTDYLYLALSTISLSFSIALHDSRVVYKKRGT